MRTEPSKSPCTRRAFNHGVGQALLSALIMRPSLGSTETRRTPSREVNRAGLPIDLIESPTNLGLRPRPSGELAGTWQAPEVLAECGLSQHITVRRETTLPRPSYDRDAQRGTRIRNGLSLRAYALQLADAVRASLAKSGFPLVIGGDCSDLMGCMLGLRRNSGRGLIYMDGHSDFFHPGNYDAVNRLGSAAGMDLALATGRGESILTRWPGVTGVLVDDADVIQLGEREAGDPGYPFREIWKTAITQITMQKIQADGVRKTIHHVLDRLSVRDISHAWLHIDADVLDQSVMPAVDSPGSPGLSYDELAEFVGAFLASGRVAGADVAIYDPTLDPDRTCARKLVQCLGKAFAVT